MYNKQEWVHRFQAMLISIPVTLCLLLSTSGGSVPTRVFAQSSTCPPATVDPNSGVEDRALVEFHVPDLGAVDDLVGRGADLAEYLRQNDDGSLTVNAFVSASQCAFYESLGYEVGITIENRATWEAAKAEREAAMAEEQGALATAQGGGNTAPLNRAQSSITFDPGGEITVQRVDYFTNYAGRFLSVEARTSLGTNSGGPTLAMAWKAAGGSYSSATSMSKFTDDNQYMYHRLLVRIGAAGSTTPVPATVRVASSTGAFVETGVNTWLGGGLPPLAGGYLKGFLTHYMDPVEGKAKINALATEFPNLAEIVNLPNLTNGYQRKSMCVMAGTTACSGTPGTASQAVFLQATIYGQDGGNNIQAEFLNPGAANQPLTVSVTGTRITVRLGTGSTGALNSTAAQVVAAINANAAASALVTARTYGGNVGTGIVQARALVSLSDFLSRPAYRGAFQQQVLRIGTQRDGSKVGVFIYCQQHAREWTTPNVCLETAERLLRNYAIDPATKDFVDNLDIFILPSSNPDGAIYSYYDSNNQRKNMTNYCSLTTTSGMPANRNGWGVDLNRNNSIGSLFDGYDGASTSCTNELYVGPSEMSEPEIQNEHWLVDTYTNNNFANNIHSYGGYFMWSPGSYILSGRVTLPAPNIGIEAYFFAGADLILGRIKEERNTAILPQRTGPIADVLYSAAGNSADDQWYRKGIIAYSFETGADRFTSSTSGTGQSEVGFQPNYASEGQPEAMEFASGNYGLLETALQYANDSTPPVANLVPNGGASKTPLTATFQYGNEPSVIYYTDDGSTPTTSSTTWNAQGPRRPGQVFLFNSTTTLKWIAKDIRGNLSGVSTACFAVETVAPSTTANLQPAGANGWYKDPTITLTGVDSGGCGTDVDKTEYSLDGGAFTTYAGPFQVTGQGSHSLVYRSTDKAGNVEGDQSLVFQIDAVAPALVSCDVPDGAWHADNVTLTCTYADNDSGPLSQTVNLVTTVAADSETDNAAATAAAPACDLVGNCVTPADIPGNRIDRKAPTVTCPSPTPTFTLNQAGAMLSATVADGGSGAAASPVSVAADTSIVGTRTVDVTGSDNVNNSTTVSCSYQVLYNFIGFMAPVDNPPTVNTGVAGKTYPVKWQLTNASGGFISDLSVVQSITYTPNQCGNFSGDPTDSLETTATGGTSLRYDSTANQFVYNWATPSVGCYSLFVTLNDGSVHTAYFNLKKK
jgi:hypothetical protein